MRTLEMISRDDSRARTASHKTWQVLLIALVAGALSTGCAFLQSSDSFSESSGSVSDSVGSSSDSSESSGSSSGDDDSAFLNEVRHYAASIFRTKAEPETLRRGISEIAMRHGISDWEARQTTFAEVGRAIQQSDIPEEERARYRLALATPGSDADRAME